MKAKATMRALAALAMTLAAAGAATTAQQGLTRAADPGMAVPVSAHRAVTVADAPGSGIAADAAACRRAVAKTIAEMTGRSAAEVEAALDDAPLAPATRFAAVISSRPGEREGTSRVGVRVFLTHAPAGGGGAKRALLPALVEMGWLKLPRVGVVVPEEHRVETQLVRVPDPAGETAIARHLEAAGFPVVEPARLARLRDDAALRAALRGDLSEADLRALKARQPDLDVLIVGEAFSVERRVSGGPVRSTVNCEANVEVKAVDLATGARLCSDRERGYGRALSGAGAGKTALEEAGSLLAPRVAESLMLWAVSARAVGDGGAGGGGAATATVRLEVRGLGGAARRDAFLDAVRAALPGVEVIRQSMEGGVLFAELRVGRADAPRLAAKLEGLPGFRFQTEGDSGGLIRGAVR